MTAENQGYTRTTLSRTQPSVAIGDEILGPPITIASSANAAQALAETERTTAQQTRGEFPAGTVVCLKTGETSKYVEATDPDRAAFGAAVVTSLIAGSAAWQSKIVSLYVNEELVAAVTLGGGDNTTALIVTALDGDAAFAAHADASGTNGNPLVITSLKKGANVSMRVSVDLTTAYAHLDDAGTSSEDYAAGTDPDFRILGGLAIGKDDALENRDAKVGRNYVAGVFSVAKLKSLTGVAKAAMSRSGFKFVA